MAAFKRWRALLRCRGYSPAAIRAIARTIDVSRERRAEVLARWGYTSYRRRNGTWRFDELVCRLTGGWGGDW